MNPSSHYPACEIITIGTELLLGQIMDTNTTYLAQELARIGVTIRFRTAVGDQLEEIKSVILSALERCDMVMTTGGLGPTFDDLTRETVARVAGVELEFRRDLMDQIEHIFHRSGYQMTENNRKQAFVPAGSLAIPNPVGTAPAFITEVNEKPIICLPGVPRELKYLLNKEVIPWIRERYNLDDHLISYRVLKVAGIGESGVDGLIADLIESGKNPQIGLLASPGEIKIRIAVTDRGEINAGALIDSVEEEIRSRLGEKIYGEGDDTLEGVIDSLLRRQNLTLAILETFSGGLIAHRLYGVPSPRLLESRVIGEEERLIRLLGKGDKIQENEAAGLLAHKIREMGTADLGLAVLGFPKKKEEGYILKGYAAIAGEEIEKSFSWQMGGDLNNLRLRGAVIGLNTLRLALLKTC
ncbi:MAG: CinA family nicotinamide mononucleotide deamidase-related protein [Thermodesulfobacteriota bacterium]|nr:CinA family nicotinamide mononucleotide deamidase-related protein [Thermodesulfobacteriota bacterium]